MRSDAIIAWSLLVIFTVLITLFLIATNKSEIKDKIPLIRNWKVFYCWLGAIAFLGGITAFFLPIALNSGFNKGDDGPTLRQLLLYTTGGILGVITLGETHRKNNLEKDKFDEQKNQFEKQLINQKENLKEQLNSQLESQREQIAAQKEKDNQEYNRQVHSERRSRYSNAIEQLASKEAVIRLGGIYTLVGLVDEWLADEGIKETKVRRMEGQVIINNLCAYIRSPFHLAEMRDVLELETPPDTYKGDFSGDQEKFFEEANIRKSIFEEINKRITVDIDPDNTNNRKIVGTWSDFNFNFSNAPIFYFLQYLTYVNSSFHGAKFYGQAFFNNSHFFGTTDFTDAVFYGDAEFDDAFFVGNVSFNWAKFNLSASFKSAFKQKVTFEGAQFIKSAGFAPSLFEGPISFKDVEFSQDPIFIEHIHIPDAHPHDCLYAPAVFSYKTKSRDHNFSVSSKSAFGITLGHTSFKNDDYEIPMGTMIFDPDSWSKKENNYLDMSSPAK